MNTMTAATLSDRTTGRRRTTGSEFHAELERAPRLVLRQLTEEANSRLQLGHFSAAVGTRCQMACDGGAFLLSQRAIDVGIELFR